MRHASQDTVGIYLLAASRLLREALARVLRTSAGLNFVGVCAPRPEAENAVLGSGAGILLLDNFNAARSDLNLMRRLSSAAPRLQVILVGMPESERAFLDSVREGAIGYVLRDASAEFVISSVRAVLNGEAACPARMIVSLYKYDSGSGIACRGFARSRHQAAYVSHPAPRALHSFPGRI